MWEEMKGGVYWCKAWGREGAHSGEGTVTAQQEATEQRDLTSQPSQQTPGAAPSEQNLLLQSLVIVRIIGSRSDSSILPCSFPTVMESTSFSGAYRNASPHCTEISSKQTCQDTQILGRE